MEIAISSSMNHPNLVQTYTYSIKQLRDEAEGVRLVGASHVHAHEVGHLSAMNEHPLTIQMHTDEACPRVL